MREKIQRLVRLREIRRDSRRRGFSQAREALRAREQALSALQAERQRTEQATLALVHALARDDVPVSSGDLAALQRAIGAGRQALERLAGHIAQAQEQREAAAADMREAARLLRAAEQNLDQIGILDGRLAEEEARQLEQMEEAEAERIPRAMKPGGRA